MLLCGLLAGGALGQSAPNVDSLPRPLSPSTIDLEAIAKGYESLQSDGHAALASAGPALLVFISFSMPEPTLIRLVDQAARAGASLLLRGFVDGSLTATVARANRLIAGRRVAFQIDPQAFDRFAVSSTPTFVLLRSAAEATDCAAASCFDRDAFVAAAGDVSIDYALRLMQRTAPRFAGEAAAFLKRLEG